MKKVIKPSEECYYKNSIQNAIFSLSGVASCIEKESKAFVYDGDSRLIPDGETHLKYNEVYELCLKTMNVLQKLQ